MTPAWYWANRKRKELRERILKRDNYSCQTCGYSPSLVIIGKRKSLHIHHIDKNRENNSDSNLITLCPSCHSKLHHLAKEIIRRKNIRLGKQIRILEDEIKETSNPRALGQLYATLEKTKDQWRTES